MSLFIEVYVGSKDNRIKVAESKAYNISNLSDLSDYKFDSIEFGNHNMGIPRSEVHGSIEDHIRNQSVWNIVEKIAAKSTK